MVPDTQFVVTRTAYRNNSSKYFVDDVPSTFTEVTKLLKAEGIDLDNNRFLILQVSCPGSRCRCSQVPQPRHSLPARPTTGSRGDFGPGCFAGCRVRWSRSQ